MPHIPFDQLPTDARVWVFAADPAPSDQAVRVLLASVDAFLAGWAAHGHPLMCAREWRDGRFLAVGVDQSTAGASGCSIDGLFRTFKRLEPELGTTLLPGSLVFWRGRDGAVHAATRMAFADRIRGGDVGEDTPVFDTTLTTAADWRTAFERPARASWHWALAPTSR